MRMYRCNLCGYIYNPDDGDPKRGIAPGTDFNDIPEHWECPICGADKGEFQPNN